MIPNKDKNRERMRQSSMIPKPKADFYFGVHLGDPEGLGLYQSWNKHSKKKKKR